MPLFVRCRSTTRSGWWKRSKGGTLTVLALFLFAMPIRVASAQQIAYTLTPTITQVDWHDEMALESTSLWGGRLGLDFGRYVALRGFYLTRDNVDTRFGQLTIRDTLGAVIPEQRVDVRNIGADVTLAFATGSIIPIAKAGGSVLRFSPESGERSQQVALSIGAGLRFGRPDQVQVELLASQWQFRLNRYRLAPAGTPIAPAQPDPLGNRTWRNMTFSAGANLPFGERVFTDEPPRLNWSQASMPVEIFAGRLDFASETGLERQDLLGARIGLDVARLLGLRAFYWRGTDGSFGSFQPVQSWGGEAQFNLNPGPGFAPFLILGAGQLDFRDDFVDPAGNPRDNRTMLIGGGGLQIGLTEQLRLNIAARDHMFAAGDLSEVSTADELRHNWMYSAGLHFGIGGGHRARLERERAERLARERAEAELRALTLRDARDTVVLIADERVGRAALADRDYSGARTVAVPVPREGELYVRYGPDETREGIRNDQPAPARMAGMQPGLADIREGVRDVVRDELERHGVVARVQREGAAEVAPSELRTTDVDLLAERVALLLSDRIRMERDTMQAMLRRELAAAPAPETAAERQEMIARIETIVEDIVARELDRRAREGQLLATPLAAPAPAARESWWQRLSPRAWYAYSGVGWRGATQALLGARADLGSPFVRHPDVRLVPELAFSAFGGTTTMMLAGNFQYRFPRFRFGGDMNIVPHLGAGAGLINFREEIGTRSGYEGVLNLGYGATLPMDAIGLGRTGSQLFIEHQGIDLYSLHRLLIGIQVSF